MAVEWTVEQREVIKARGGSVLVSAAAGSGKTAVLIERILRMISDPEAPVDVDRLLVVTFTDAAAAEIKDRLYKAIRKRLQDEPNDRRMRRQLKLLEKAEVSTIHSFCSRVLKNHFHEIGLDPAFRVADSNETALLKSDVFQSMIEEEYQEARTSFIDFTEDFSTGKSDDKIEELVLRLYAFSESDPWPENWLGKALETYEVEKDEDILTLPWALWYTSQLEARKDDFIEVYRTHVEELRCDPELSSLTKIYDKDLEALAAIGHFETLKDAGEKLSAFTFNKRAGSAVPKGEASEQEKAVREKLKTEFGKIAKASAIFHEGCASGLQKAAASVRELIHLTLRFSECYSREKRRKNLLDYGDLEHLALEVLVKDGEPSDAAREMAENYHEIMIDEYQDSNYVQEELLSAVAKKTDGVVTNLFMVGDMKQSIYRFRMARPELFLGKYHRFKEEGGPERRIELDMNFRSALSVVSPVNFFFRSIMQPYAGGIQYDEKAELKNGRSPEKEEGYCGYRAEILLYQQTAEAAEADEEDENDNASGKKGDSEKDLREAEAEARMIGIEIRKLLEEGMEIPDKDAGKRMLRYGDIAILLRGTKREGNIFRDVFEEMGIPLYMENRGGFYDTFEIRTVLSLLEIIDNPINDIALAAAMTSPIFSFTGDELSRIRVLYREEEGNGFYGAVSAYPRQMQDALAAKCTAFLEQIEKWRQLSSRMSLSELIRTILDESSFVSFAAAMPGGKRRSGNLNALVSRAAQYESGSYRGIFHFIRYVDRIRESATADEGETVDAESGENAVRLMTIHGSKGLEFPVVFVARLGTKINNQDYSQNVILHPDLGIGVRAIDHVRRTKENTLTYEVFREKSRAENYGEEVRILYVAMTRAREKLYLTGSLKKNQDFAEIQKQFKKEPGPLSYSKLVYANSMLDWILAAYRYSAPIALRVMTEGDLFLEDAAQAEKKDASQRKLLQDLWEKAGESDAAYRKLLEELSADHHYDELRRVSVSTTVSALKAAMHVDPEEPPQEILVDDFPAGEDSQGSAAIPDFSPTLPSFMKEESGITGARRGTVYHRVMELIDPEKDPEEELLRLTKAGLISPSEQATIKSDKIRAFLNSSLGKRFREALLREQAFREKQFIIGVPVSELQKGLKLPDDSPLQMIQGVIDMGFMEDGEYILADYKTDRVTDALTLIERYRIQLDLYARALTQATGLPVREKWIYSFELGKEIRL